MDNLLSVSLELLKKTTNLSLTEMQMLNEVPGKDSPREIGSPPLLLKLETSENPRYPSTSHQRNRSVGAKVV